MNERNASSGGRRFKAVIVFALAFVGVVLLLVTDHQGQSHRYLKLESDNTVSGGTAILKMLSFGGRLGDQMFMYASTLAVALRYGMHHCLVQYNESRREMSKIFVGPFEFCDEGDHGTKWNGGGGSGGRTDLTSFPAEDAEGQTVGLFGYMHWTDNFMEVKDRVFEAFTLVPEVQAKAEEHLKPYGDAVRVGVHIRRGDKAYMARKWDATYYEQTFDYMRKKHAKNDRTVVFIVATDDKDWVKTQDTFKKADVNVLEGTSCQDDLAILINCDHGILSGGGFGFWFAFLGPWQHGGEVLMNKNQEPHSRLEEWTFIEDVVR
mmetsp:Transcript_12115/g.34677  ORF Transcript_12115/g.34677 Transcript_12115/m.34677 type:complete len:320 (+) Transcript_12115:77-1036(+)